MSTQTQPIETLTAEQRDKFRHHLRVGRIDQLTPRISEAFIPEAALKADWDDYEDDTALSTDWPLADPSPGTSTLAMDPAGHGGKALHSKGGRRFRQINPSLNREDPRRPIYMRAWIYDPMTTAGGGSIAGREYIQFGSWLAFGIYNNVDVGEWRGSQYQLRFAGGGGPGWIQLETPRTVGWHLFELILAYDRLWLYIDKRLDPAAEGLRGSMGVPGDVGVINIGSGLSSQGDLYYGPVDAGYLVPGELDGLLSQRVLAGTTAPGSNGVAAGENSGAAAGGTAVGPDASAWGEDGPTAVGRGASAQGERSLAAGRAASATGQSSTALGNSSSANGMNSTAVGDRAEATTTGALAAGMMAKANGTSSTALGSGSKAAGNLSVAIGSGADTPSPQSVAIGSNAKTGPDGTVAIGPNATCFMPNSVALGAEATHPDQVALGARHVEMGVTEEPTAFPPKGKVRFFFREGPPEDYFIEFCVQFSNGVIKVITTSEE